MTQSKKNSTAGIPPYANQNALYFQVTNKCTDESHPYGVHREGHGHGFVRYVRWAPEETQKYEQYFLDIPGIQERINAPR